MICFPEYLSQFIATNNENKFNNTLVQLTVEENIKKLTKGNINLNFIT